MNQLDPLTEAQSQLNNCSYGIIVDDSGASKLDPEELQQDLIHLERTKRHLAEKNAELNNQIRTSEDDNNSLRQHCHDLEQALNGVQHRLTGVCRMEEEIKELQSMLDVEREDKTQMQKKLSNIEKENDTLSSRLKKLQEKLNDAQEDLESLKLHETNLVEEHKIEVTLLVQKMHQYKAEALREAEAVKYIEETVETLKKITEALRDEKSSLEEQLIHIKGQLASVTFHSEHEISGEVEEASAIQDSSRSKIPKMPWGPSMFSSPFTMELCNNSTQDTPLSIHSEIQTMDDNDGSLPFCEKSEEGFLSPSFSPDGENSSNLTTQSGKGNASLSLLINMLNWWSSWEEQGGPILKEFDNERTSALYAHFLKHREELLKLEKELQNIIRTRQSNESPVSSQNSSRKSSKCTPSLPTRRLSSNASLDSPSSELNLETPMVTPGSRASSLSNFRAPGPNVSHLINKFEHSSQSPSPSVSEQSERSSVVDYNSNVAKGTVLEGCGVPSESKEIKSPTHYDYMRDSKILRKFVTAQSGGDRPSDTITPDRQVRDELFMNASGTKDIEEDLINTLPQDSHVTDVLDSGFEQDTECSTTSGTQPIYRHISNHVGKGKSSECPKEDLDDKGIILDTGLDVDSDVEKDSQVDEEEVMTPLRRKLLLKCNTATSAGSTTVEMDMELESDVYMESSQLMKLMREVKNQEAIIKTLKRQLNESEEKKESYSYLLDRIRRIVMQVTRDTFRWTEEVRKEWLSAVPGGRENEGSTDPLRTTDPLEDGPLTSTHSREEIESLIHTRCDLGCQVVSRDDLAKDYVNPESLAIELERELLALKLHVARSHALLHHYQSSSLHGSRSEVSTPPVAAPHHVQGVEAGVEADLCGPTCIPRPCNSTATQTPASPLSTSPECEASVGEEAPGSACGSNDGVTDELLQDDHPPLTPQHRPLYQRMSVSEEEVEEESGCGPEMAVSCEHAIYAPKPTYDQLDQYSSPSKKQEEKQRRSGLGTTIATQVGVSSESEGEEEVLSRRVTFCPPPMARRNRPPLIRQPKSISDAEVAPLSPPPSLDKEEDEEELVEEEEPELPSTPESGPSNTSAPELYTTTARVMISNIKEEEEDTDNRLHLPQLTISPTTTTTIITTPTTPTNTFNPAVPPTTNSKIPEVSVFPSLQDAHLKALGVSAFEKPNNKNLSPQEIENKFKQLSLAFKTDRLTLQQRRIVQQSQIENAEANFEKELTYLKSSLLALHDNCIDQDLNDAVIQVRKHLDVVTLSSNSLLTASEGWGAIQQELSISQAVEVLLLHVENVIRLYESDHQELQEMRKILNEHDTDLPLSPVNTIAGQSSSTDSPITPSRRIRALSLAILSKQQSHEVGSRRISLVPGSSKTVIKDFGGRHSRRRASLMPDLRPYHQELTAIAASASCLSKDKTEEKRHSTNGMLKSSITEEGSESGDEVTTNPQGGASENSPIATSLTNLPDFPVDLYDSSLQDSDQRSDDEVGSSPIHTPTAESHVSNNPATTLAPQSQHWLMVVVEDVLGWVRGGQWPFSLQQTYQGARYAFTSLLLLLAAFFLLLTISSGNDRIHRPCHPGWSTVEHVLHPFVTICHAGTPPT